LKETDIEFMRCISRRANVIPVISKSDSMTKYELIAFKQQVIYQMRI
jgi:cell division control protein 11